MKTKFAVAARINELLGRLPIEVHAALVGLSSASEKANSRVWSIIAEFAAEAGVATEFVVRSEVQAWVFNYVNHPESKLPLGPSHVAELITLAGIGAEQGLEMLLHTSSEPPSEPTANF